MTDGQANQPNTMQPCNYFNTKANVAKAAGQTIFTIAYGLDSPPVNCDFDTTGAVRGQVRDHQPGVGGDRVDRRCARWLRSRTRTRTATTTSAPPARADLEPVFRQVAAAAIETAHLID